jgi:hypothetical protein
MYSLRARYIPLGLGLLLVLGTSSCRRESSYQKKGVKFRCGDQIVYVDSKTGANPVAVYLCADDTVTWSSNDRKFKVEFMQDSPFSNDEKAFDNAHSKSQGAKHLKQLTVYEYKITVDGKEFDPQVIIGGGN